MFSRRHLMQTFVAVMGTAIAARARANKPLRLAFIHGRAQQGKNPEVLKSEWIQALTEGVNSLGAELPEVLEISLPFYGDQLDEFARQLSIPLTSDIKAKGDALQDEFLVFQAQVAEEIRLKAGVTDNQVDVEYGPNPKPKGPLNWEWVQAILRALDEHGGGLSASAIEQFTRDVFLYTTRAGVRDAIDEIVAPAITEDPTVVIAHSLGCVVAYNILRNDRRKLQIPLFATIGCPLGIRAIRDQFRPLKYPSPVAAWYNAFDPRDVVALFPLDQANFPVKPDIENYGLVDNHTDNRHGIVGYLNDKSIAQKILAAVRQ